MTRLSKKAKLIGLLNELSKMPDTEIAHRAADDALVDYIGDEEIAVAYESVGRWFA